MSEKNEKSLYLHNVLIDLRENCQADAECLNLPAVKIQIIN